MISACFNNGKVVLTGNLRKVKKDFGKNTVLIEFEGDPGFLDELEHVRINNRSTNFAEIRILGGLNHQDILRKAMERTEVHKFQLVEPSLNEIFISTVGEDNIKQQELLA
jgi:ABC-2 type transport system ATP-binding protein